MTHQALPEPLSPPPEALISNQKVLKLLKAHLLPSPQLNYLPTALLHIRHFHVLAKGVVRQCERVLAEDAKLCNELEKHGIDWQEMSEYGALNQEETLMMRRFIDAGLAAELAQISLAWRTWHLAMLLSSVKVENVTPILENYFPVVLDGARVSRYVELDGKDHHHEVDNEYRANYAEERRAVMRWWKIAEDAKEKRGRPPKLLTLTTLFKSDHGTMMVERTLEAVNSALKQAEYLESLFDNHSDEDEDDQELDGNMIPNLSDNDHGVEKDGMAGVPDDLATRLRSDHPADQISAPNAYTSSSKATGVKRTLGSAIDLEMEQAEPVSPRTVVVAQTRDPSNGITTSAIIPSSDGKAKKSRLSSTPTGIPDYTAPVTSMGSNLDRKQLKPFQDSKFRKTSNLSPSQSRQLQAKSEGAAGSRNDPIEM